MKTVTLPIRIDEDLKKAFIQTAKDQDSDASKELRKFIRQYVAKHGQRRMSL